MIELRNKQHATVIDCVAGEALEVGQVIKLQDDGNGVLEAVVAAAAADASVWGTMIAWWINPRSEAVEYEGDADGIGLTLAAATDTDAIHFIPSGSRMVAVGGKGVTEVRYFVDSLNDDFAVTLPAVGDVLGVSSADSKLCEFDAGDVIVSFDAAARVVEADAVSVTVILG